MTRRLLLEADLSSEADLSLLFVIVFCFLLPRYLGRWRGLAAFGGIPKLDADIGAGGSRFVAIQLAAVVRLVRANRVDDDAVGISAIAQWLAVIGINRNGSHL